MPPRLSTPVEGLRGSGNSLQKRQFCPCRSPCYAGRRAGDGRVRASVEHQVELSAENLWEEISGRLKEALSDGTYSKWFGDVHESRARRRHPRAHRSERVHARLDRGPLPRPDRRRGARHRRRRAPARAPGRRRCSAVDGGPRGVGGRCSHGPTHVRSPRERWLQREVHVRLVRDRLVEPLRPRGRARRRRGAGAGVQPALHLRQHGPRQDASAPGRRAVRRRALLARSPCAT